MTTPIPYRDAMAELEAILGEIERDDVDVDVLSDRVKRAAELIRLCRERIETTRIEVEEIVTGLEPPPDRRADSTPVEGEGSAE